MAEHEYPYLDRPDKLEYPTETWAAHEVRKSDIFCVAAMCSTGAVRASFIERAEYFFRNATETLRPMPTRTLARPVVILLTSGLVLPWLRTHPEATLPEPGTAPTFPPQRRFVPQKQIAKRRLVTLAVLGLMSVATLLAALLI
jgi:hypothetical protein